MKKIIELEKHLNTNKDYDWSVNIPKGYTLQMIDGEPFAVLDWSGWYKRQYDQASVDLFYESQIYYYDVKEATPKQYAYNHYTSTPNSPVFCKTREQLDRMLLLNKMVNMLKLHELESELKISISDDGKEKLKQYFSEDDIKTVFQ